MNELLKKTMLGLFAGAAVVAISGTASATSSKNWCQPSEPECLVIASASDYCPPRNANGSYKNPYFWGVSFAKGCDDGYISSITIDLTAGSDANAVFDLEGSGSYGPVIGSKSGLSSSDISFSDSDGKSSLTISFAEGSFGVGDSLLFGADTDYLKDDDAKSVGWQKVGFSVTFANGNTVSSSFSKYNNKLSKAKVKTDDCCGTSIPTPAAAGMGLALLGGIATRRRRAA